jgi:hypothetical protein
MVTVVWYSRLVATRRTCRAGSRAATDLLHIATKTAGRLTRALLKGAL